MRLEIALFLKLHQCFRTMADWSGYSVFKSCDFYFECFDGRRSNLQSYFKVTFITFNSYYGGFLSRAVSFSQHKKTVRGKLY